MGCFFAILTAAGSSGQPGAVANHSGLVESAKNRAWQDSRRPKHGAIQKFPAPSGGRAGG